MCYLGCESAGFRLIILLINEMRDEDGVFSNFEARRISGGNKTKGCE